MRRILLAGIAIVALAAGSASAADMPTKAPVYKAPPVAGCGYNDITAANNQISVDYATTNINYVEYNPANPLYTLPGLAVGAPLDTEKGWLPGVAVTGSAMFNIGSVCNVYVFGRVSYFSGNETYWQNGPGGQTHSTIWEPDFRIGKGFDVAPNVMVTPYLGGGYRDWTRNLCQAGACLGGGYHEEYSDGYLGAGLMVQVAPVSRLVLSGSGLVGGTVGSQLQGGPLAGGTTGVIPFQTSLGNSLIYKLEGTADYAFTPNLHGNVGVEYTNFKYGQSAPFVFSPGGGTAIEPNSRTSTVTVRVGLGWAFAAPVVAKY